jgi:undecaprenyl pyrophosphate phosphatase UppP
MSYETLLIILGAVLSLLFSYVPGLASWFNPLDDTKKRLIMLVLLAVITGAVFGLSCAGIISAVTCDKPGAIGLITAFLFALMANQGTNALSPKIGLKTPIAKDVILTTSAGKTSVVGITELGTAAPVDETAKDKVK